jgi:competence protein ComEA
MRTLRKMLCALLLSLPIGVIGAEPVDVNSANAEAIAEAIKGVGLSRAEAIIDYRDKHGPFESVDDLVLVRGIGAKAIDDNREALTTQRK